MKKPRINPEGHELLRQVVEQYQPKTINDIQEMLKDLFADTIEDMLKAELDTELGYAKNSQDPKQTDNRRNGSYPKILSTQLCKHSERIYKSHPSPQSKSSLPQIILQLG